MSDYKLEPKSIVDELAQFIRQVDGNNKMGAGSLADKICERFHVHSPDVQGEPVAAVVREHDGRAFAVLRPAGENLPDGTELYAAPVVAQTADDARGGQDMKYEYKTHAAYRGYGWIEPLTDSEDSLIEDYLARRICEELNTLQAECEKLLAEATEWKRVASAQAELHGEAEDRAEMLADALERIAVWPDGGNQYGQRNIKIFAAEALAAHRKGGSDDE